MRQGNKLSYLIQFLEIKVLERDWTEEAQT